MKNCNYKEKDKDNATNKKEKKTFSRKEMPFCEINKKLEDFISGFKAKAPPANINFEKKINPPNLDNTINTKELNINNNFIFSSINQEEKEKEENENQLSKALTRLEIDNFMASDQFAENYTIIPSMCWYNRNNELIYSKPFDDNELLEDESLFFAVDKRYKNKFISSDDLKAIKKEEVKLNFGADPIEIFAKLSEGIIQPHEKKAQEWYYSLSNENIFQSRDPYYMNIRMNNESFSLINNNNNFNNNEPKNIFDAVQRAKQNNGINNELASIVISNNELFYKNDLCDQKSTEVMNDKENESNINNNKHIGKKRKKKH